MKKLFTLILSVSLSAVLLTACSTGYNAQGRQSTAASPANAATSQQAAASTAVSSPDQSTGSQSAPTGEKVFTKEELAKYDGQGGNSAYVAVDGVVYDVTNVKQWRNGQHNGYQAGVDLTEAFKTSPHDSSIFNGIPVVGKYAG